MNNQQAITPPSAPGQAGQRSEGLLPADEADANLEVAEEVNLDLQSDRTRRVGALAPDTPPGKPAEALAKALEPGPQAGDTPLGQAIERAVPPSA